MGWCVQVHVTYHEDKLKIVCVGDRWMGVCSIRTYVGLACNWTLGECIREVWHNTQHKHVQDKPDFLLERFFFSDSICSIFLVHCLNNSDAREKIFQEMAFYSDTLCQLGLLFSVLKGTR